VVPIAGQSSVPGACTGISNSTTGSNFYSYYISALSSTPITYTYTAISGNSTISNSTTAWFNVSAPSGVKVGPPIGMKFREALAHWGRQTHILCSIRF